jgi:hypothetical protein
VQDPGNPQSLNRYSYCLNNPLRYVDPTGHLTMEEYYAGMTMYGIAPEAVNLVPVTTSTSTISDTYQYSAGMTQYGVAPSTNPIDANSASYPSISNSTQLVLPLVNTTSGPGSPNILPVVGIDGIINGTSMLPESLYHYSPADAWSIESEGLISSSGKVWATSSGSLSPIEAQTKLSLDPVKGLPNSVVKINVAKCLDAGLTIKGPSQVAGLYNMPGGGIEYTIEGPPGVVVPRYALEVTSINGFSMPKFDIFSFPCGGTSELFPGDVPDIFWWMCPW